MAALEGSEALKRGPESTLNPSAQKWRVRDMGVRGWEGLEAVSGIISLGVSSPPRVRAVPVKREVGGWGSSPPGRDIFLSVLLGAGYSENLHRMYLFARSMIFLFRSSGFSTARPDFSPPAYRF